MNFERNTWKKKNDITERLLEGTPGEMSKGKNPWILGEILKRNPIKISHEWINVKGISN